MSPEQHLTTARIEAFVTGLAAAEECASVEAHIEQCEQCLQRVASEARRETMLFEIAEELALHSADQRTLEAPASIGEARPPDEADSLLRRLIDWWTMPARTRASAWGLRLAPIAVIAIALVLVFPRTEEVQLPAYFTSLEGGIQDVRGPAAGASTPTFSTGSHIQLVLRPETAHDSPVQVLLFIDGQPAKYGFEVEVAPTGAVRATGTWPTTDLAEGEHVIQAAIGPASARWEEQATELGLSAANRQSGFSLHEQPFAWSRH